MRENRNIAILNNLLEMVDNYCRTSIMTSRRFQSRLEPPGTKIAGSLCQATKHVASLHNMLDHMPLIEDVLHPLVLDNIGGMDPHPPVLVGN
jgi:hypothetical protein